MLMGAETRIKKKELRPKQTLRDVKEKWKAMAIANSVASREDPLLCTHEHCNYWRNNSTKQIWLKEIKILEKKVKQLQEEKENKEAEND